MSPLEQVSKALWAERHLLEQLLFKVEEERAMVAIGETRFVSRCLDEIHAVMERLEMAEQHRAAIWSQVARQLGLPDDASLRELIGKAAYPWDTILTEHQRAMSGTAREITDSANCDERLNEATEVCSRLSWLVPASAVA